MDHTEERRKRIVEEFQKVGDVRLDREQESLVEYLEELENEADKKIEK